MADTCSMNAPTYRCYAEQEQDDLWVAVCIDLCLAAQGQSYLEARAKLEDQIADYVFDALKGQDQAHASRLLNRKAPLRQRFKYHLARFAWARQLLHSHLRRFIGVPNLAPAERRYHPA